MTLRAGGIKKFMNDPARMAAESLAGFVAAHSDLVEFGPGGNFIRRKVLSPGKVGVVSGGGSGHEPLHVGFVGHGMLDAACPGHIFTSPTPNQISEAIAAVDQGEGVLLIVKNYDGDVMNFELGAERAAAEGHEVRVVLVADDASGGEAGRRGVAGTLFVEKVIGAAAEQGLALDAVARLGAHACQAVRTVGVALRGASLPSATRQTFVLDEGRMEMGVGIHGEPGRASQPIEAASSVVASMCGLLQADLGRTQMPLLLFVNGLGGTPLSEQYLVYGMAHEFWTRRNYRVERSLVGSFVTSLDTAGVSISVAALDEELTRLWDAPVNTPALRW